MKLVKQTIIEYVCLLCFLFIIVVDVDTFFFLFLLSSCKFQYSKGFRFVCCDRLYKGDIMIPCN